MALNYKQCNTGEDISHVCDPCLVAEKGGVRSFFMVKENATITLLSTASEWTAAITAGNIIIIPETRGTYDGGTPKMGAGYGDIKERVIGYDNVLAIKDPNYAANSQFWAWAEKLKWRFGFRTDTLVHLSKKSGMVNSKAPVEEDTDTEVVWNVEAKWFDSDKIEVASVEPLKDFFKCFEITPGG